MQPPQMEFLARPRVPVAHVLSVPNFRSSYRSGDRKLAAYNANIYRFFFESLSCSWLALHKKFP